MKNLVTIIMTFISLNTFSSTLEEQVAITHIHEDTSGTMLTTIEGKVSNPYSDGMIDLANIGMDTQYTLRIYKNLTIDLKKTEISSTHISSIDKAMLEYDEVLKARLDSLRAYAMSIRPFEKPMVEASRKMTEEENPNVMRIALNTIIKTVMVTPKTFLDVLKTGPDAYHNASIVDIKEFKDELDSAIAEALAYNQD